MWQMFQMTSIQYLKKYLCEYVLNVCAMPLAIKSQLLQQIPLSFLQVVSFQGWSRQNN